MQGAVGNASTVPGGVIARMCSRARACCSRAVAASRSGDLGGELHAFGDAGPEPRMFAWSTKSP